METHGESPLSLASGLLEPRVARFLQEARVARLATVDGAGQPTVLPICYAFDGKSIYTPVDEKPKRKPPEQLRRVRDILSTGRVALVVDRYVDHEWSCLRYLLVRGHAGVVEEPEEYARALILLRSKYPQYRGMHLEGRLVIRIVPEQVVSWGAVS